MKQNYALKSLVLFVFALSLMAFTKGIPTSATIVNGESTFNAISSIEPTVITDQDDYAPGSTAIITGTGFQPGEVVELHVHHADGDPMGTDPQYHQPWSVTADVNGNFTTSWYVPTEAEGDALGAIFLLEAHGSLGSNAEWTFTDGNVTFKTSGLPAGVNVTVNYSFPNDGLEKYITFSTNAPGTSDSFATGGMNSKPVNLYHSFPAIIVDGSNTYNFLSSSSTSPVLSVNAGLTITGTYELAGGSGGLTVTAPDCAQGGSFTIMYTPTSGSAVTETRTTPFSFTAKKNTSYSITSIASTYNGNTYTGSTSVTGTTPNSNDFDITQTLVYNDTQAPVITATGTTLTLGCNPLAADIEAALGTATATDNCSVGTPTASDGAVSGTCSKSQTRTWNVSDGSDNPATVVSRTVTWTIDTEAPAITTNVSDKDLGCNPTTIEFGTPVFDGECSTAEAVANYPMTGLVIEDGCNRSQTKTWRVTDCSGLVTETSQKLSWTVDTEAPVITQATGDANGTDLGCNPTVTAPTFTIDDECNPNAVVSIEDRGVQGDSCAKSQTWTATYSNDCHTSDSVSITYTWTVDTEAPAITTPVVDAALGCNPTTIEFGTPVFDGGCSTAVAVDTYPMTGDVVVDGCNRSQTKTWRVTDCSGLVTETSQKLTWTIDTEAPVITQATGDANGTDLGCNPTVTAPTFTIDDECNPNAVVSVEDGGVQGDSCAKSQTWTATYSNDCHTSNTVSITYTWTEDTEAPVITQTTGEPVDGANLGCNPIVTAPTFGATDNCGVGTVIVTSDGPTGDLCARTQTWKANVSDNCTKPATEVTVTYTWTEDTEAPTITTPVVDAALGCNPTTIEFGKPVFDGGCSYAVAVDTYPMTGDVVVDGCNRSQTKTWKMTDCSGLVTETSQKLTWTVDTEAPVITQATGDADGTDLGCNPTVTAPTFTIDDECNPDAVVSVEDGGVQGDSCAKSQTWTATYSNDCHTSNTVSITYTWTEDTEAPTITTPVVDAALGCNPTTIEFGTPVFDGGCSSAVAVDTYPMTGDVVVDGCNRSQTKTWKMTDCSGLVTETSQKLTWTIDTEAPVITQATGDADGTDLGCNPTVTAPTFTIDDECNPDAVVSVEDGGVQGDSCAKSQTWTATYSNNCHTSNTVSITYTWTEDTTAPDLGAIVEIDPQPINTPFTLQALSSGDSCSAATATWYFSSNGSFDDSATIADFILTGTLNGGYAQGNFSSTNFISAASPTGTGVYSVKLVVKDDCGNESIKIYDYVVIYDPSGGFVTGGGWIDSPAEAMNSGVTGKANFGFNAKYKSGKNNTNEVEGNTNFQFKAGDLHFSSIQHNNIELVISGAKATYTGTGTINGTGNFKFRVVAIDGDINGGGGIDKFRIKIWTDPSNPIYDNQRGKSETGDDASTLGGGSIVIHKPKGGKNNAKTASSKAEVVVEEEVIEGFNLSSWPNPSSNYFNIKLKSSNSIDKIKILVFDVNGRLVSKKSGDANKEYQIGIELQAGLYFVNVIQGNESQNVKLIKQ